MPENTPTPDRPDRSDQPPESAPAETAADTTAVPASTTPPGTETLASEEASTAATEHTATQEALVAGGTGGQRVTRRTIHRRETEETTQETITEDLPLYSGPVSDHPAPVG